MSAFIEDNLFVNMSSDAGGEIPAYAGMTGGGIPAYAGMTWWGIPAYAGMTGGGGNGGMGCMNDRMGAGYDVI